MWARLIEASVSVRGDLITPCKCFPWSDCLSSLLVMLINRIFFKNEKLIMNLWQSAQYQKMDAISIFQEKQKRQTVNHFISCPKKQCDLQHGILKVWNSESENVLLISRHVLAAIPRHNSHQFAMLLQQFAWAVIFISQWSCEEYYSAE